MRTGRLVPSGQFTEFAVARKLPVVAAVLKSRLRTVILNRMNMRLILRGAGQSEYRVPRLPNGIQLLGGIDGQTPFAVYSVSGMVCQAAFCTSVSSGGLRQMCLKDGGCGLNQLSRCEEAFELLQRITEDQQVICASWVSGGKSGYLQQRMALLLTCIPR